MRAGKIDIEQYEINRVSESCSLICIMLIFVFSNSQKIQAIIPMQKVYHMS
jgi:hypothetical protein